MSGAKVRSGTAKVRRCKMRAAAKVRTATEMSRAPDMSAAASKMSAAPAAAEMPPAAAVRRGDCRRRSAEGKRCNNCQDCLTHHFLRIIPPCFQLPEQRAIAAMIVRTCRRCDDRSRQKS
jgi:hypothetical protein